MIICCISLFLWKLLCSDLGTDNRFGGCALRSHFEFLDMRLEKSHAIKLWSFI